MLITFNYINLYTGILIASNIEIALFLFSIALGLLSDPFSSLFVKLKLTSSGPENNLLIFHILLKIIHKI